MGNGSISKKACNFDRAPDGCWVKIICRDRRWFFGKEGETMVCGHINFPEKMVAVIRNPEPNDIELGIQLCCSKRGQKWIQTNSFKVKIYAKETTLISVPYFKGHKTQDIRRLKFSYDNDKYHCTFKYFV